MKRPQRRNVMVQQFERAQKPIIAADTIKPAGRRAHRLDLKDRARLPQHPADIFDQAVQIVRARRAADDLILSGKPCIFGIIQQIQNQPHLRQRLGIADQSRSKLFFPTRQQSHGFDIADRQAGLTDLDLTCEGENVML